MNRVGRKNMAVVTFNVCVCVYIPVCVGLHDTDYSASYFLYI